MNRRIFIIFLTGLLLSFKTKLLSFFYREEVISEKEIQCKDELLG